MLSYSRHARRDEHHDSFIYFHLFSPALFFLTSIISIQVKQISEQQASIYRKKQAKKRRFANLLLKNYLCLMNEPTPSSSNAFSSSSLVFITMGPPQATGSFSGAPEKRMTLIPSPPARRVRVSPLEVRLAL